MTAQHQKLFDDERGHGVITNESKRTIATANNPVDARRLVACWNAFEGHPIEFIEELAQIGGVSALTIHANDLREKRDELLAALVLARNEVAYMASGMTHAGWKTMEAQKALSVIDAAIQKATKEQV